MASDEDDSLWGYVDTNTERSENVDSDNESMVMVSRCMSTHIHLSVSGR